MESMTLSSGTRASELIISTTSLGSAVEISGTWPAVSPVVHFVLNSDQENCSILTVTSGFFVWNSSAIFFIQSARGPWVKEDHMVTVPRRGPVPSSSAESLPPHAASAPHMPMPPRTMKPRRLSAEAEWDETGVEGVMTVLL